MITLAAPLWMYRCLRCCPSDNLWLDLLGFGVTAMLILSLIVIVYCWLKDNELI
nr:MAG TPA: hypothetical protein [Caudoviricetes sp.]